MDIFLNKKAEKFIDDIPVFCEDMYWGKSKENVLLEAINVIDSDGWSKFNDRFSMKV